MSRLADDRWPTVVDESLALAAALRRGSHADIVRIERRLERIRTHVVGDTWFGGAIDALLTLARASRSDDTDGGQTRRSRRLEPSSLAMRMLQLIADGATVSNADLAEMLETDAQQLSRAGRRLRDLRLAERVRLGRVNVWNVTDAGRDELRQPGR